MGKEGDKNERGWRGREKRCGSDGEEKQQKGRVRNSEREKGEKQVRVREREMGGDGKEEMEEQRGIGEWRE